MLEHALTITLHGRRTQAFAATFAATVTPVIPHNHVHPRIVIVVEPFLLSRHELIITRIWVAEDHSRCLSIQPLFGISAWNNHAVDLLSVKRSDPELLRIELYLQLGPGCLKQPEWQSLEKALHLLFKRSGLEYMCLAELVKLIH